MGALSALHEGKDAISLRDRPRALPRCPAVPSVGPSPPRARFFSARGSFRCRSVNRGTSLKCQMEPSNVHSHLYNNININIL